MEGEGDDPIPQKGILQPYLQKKLKNKVLLLHLESNRKKAVKCLSSHSLKVDQKMYSVLVHEEMFIIFSQETQESQGPSPALNFYFYKSLIKLLPLRTYPFE